MSVEKELWDIYDENKLPTGETIDRYNFSLNSKQFHLTVIAILWICTVTLYQKKI